VQSVGWGTRYCWGCSITEAHSSESGAREVAPGPGRVAGREVVRRPGPVRGWFVGVVGVVVVVGIVEVVMVVVVVEVVVVVLVVVVEM
jgi:hypothetical protein